MCKDNVYQPCEHVTLFFTGDGADDDPKGNTIDRANYTWDIPPKYFSDDRGSMCTIQIVSGSMNLYDGHRSVGIFLMNGSVNGFTINDKVKTATNAEIPPDVACLGVVNEENGNAGGIVHATGEYLISARPQNLHLKLVYLTGNTESEVVAPTPHLAGLIVVKFTYYDPTNSAVNMLDHQNYKTL